MTGWFSHLFSPRSVPARRPALPVVAAEAKPEEAEPAQAEPAAVAAHHTAFQRVSWMQSDGLNAELMNWLFEGNDDSDLFANPWEQEILAALEKIVGSNQAGANLVRRMPGVVPQLLHSLRTDNFSGTELARTISHDVVLVAAVIRLSNSSLYKCKEAITSIEHAILVLGQAGLRQLITSVAFKPIVDLKAGYFTRSIAPRLWELSEHCARANRVLAEGEEIVAFDAFLAGLIQHVGLIVALRVIDQLSDQKQNVGSSIFCSSLVAYGRKISAGIAREWNFSPSVVRALEEQGNFNRQVDMSTLGQLLESGDYASKLKVLSDHRRVRADDPYWIKGISEKALACLHKMDELAAPPVGEPHE